jgi:hypothetical protein
MLSADQVEAAKQKLQEGGTTPGFLAWLGEMRGAIEPPAGEPPLNEVSGWPFETLRVSHPDLGCRGVDAQDLVLAVQDLPRDPSRRALGHPAAGAPT